MGSKHFATLALGDPRVLEEQIEDSMKSRSGAYYERQIGGSASWAEQGGIDWQLEWVRLTTPLGLRIDLYTNDTVGNAAIGEELWVGVLKGKAIPAIPTGAEKIEIPGSSEGSSAGSSAGSGGIPSGGVGYGMVSPPISGMGGVESEGIEEVRRSNAGPVIGLILGTVGAVGSGAMLWRTRGRKKSRKRPVVVGALVGSGLVALGSGLALLFRRH